MKYHYVYRITNINEQKHYYGVRSSNIEPNRDLGIKYFSSSSNKEFINLQISHPKKFKYKIVIIYNTRIDAIKREIKLHEKFNVGINESFYNRSKQTSIGFDTTGTKHSISRKIKHSNFMKEFRFTDESKVKMSNSKKGNKNPMYGKPRSIEDKRKISEANKGRIMTDEWKNNMSKNHADFSGDKNPMYGVDRSGEKNPNYGKRAMNNGIHYKMVSKNKIKEYENKGWTYGKNKLEKLL